MFTSSTFEFIFLAASNSHILFCFCNLIIAILLIGTKPVFGFHRQVNIPPPILTVNEGSHDMVDNDTSIIETSITQNAMVDDGDHETANVDEVDNKQNVSIVNKEHTRDEEGNQMKEEEEEEEDCEDHEGDELRRRVEEFINKTNKAWEAEKLGHIPIYSS